MSWYVSCSDTATRKCQLTGDTNIIRMVQNFAAIKFETAESCPECATLWPYNRLFWGSFPKYRMGVSCDCVVCGSEAKVQALPSHQGTCRTTNQPRRKVPDDMLVGGFNPSEKKIVNWDDYSQYMGK